MTEETNCPFCTAPEVFASNELALARYDHYPVSPGHALIIPRRHFADLFDASAEEREAMWQLMEAVKEQLDRERQPAGYNVGVNVGRPAGQTVMHMHVHLIPRYAGDTEDPAGGVRAVIPGKQQY